LAKSFDPSVSLPFGNNTEATFSMVRYLLEVLPLHLACALDPPAIVIEKLLHANVETAGMTMTKGRSKKPKLRFFRHRKKNEMNGIEEEALFRTSDSVNGLPASPSGVTSSLRSDDYSGGMKHDDDDDDDQEHAPCPRTALHENPLLNDADCLLPLHLACLYRASPGVIGHLCEAHPAGAKCFALGGMLPIHMPLGRISNSTSNHGTGGLYDTPPRLETGRFVAII
jgi:hypothetical protein